MWVQCQSLCLCLCVSVCDTDWRYFVCVLLFSTSGCIYFRLSVLSKVEWMLSKWIGLPYVHLYQAIAEFWPTYTVRATELWELFADCAAIIVQHQMFQPIIMCLLCVVPCHILHVPKTPSYFCVTCCLVTVMTLQTKFPSKVTFFLVSLDTSYILPTEPWVALLWSKKHLTLWS